AVAELLGDLGGDRGLVALELDVHLQRVGDLGQGVGRELHVDHGTGDGHHAAVLELALGGLGLGQCARHDETAPCSARFSAAGPAGPVAPAWRSASAPPTISMISVVMVSCRARFMTRVRFVIRSSALSVAAFIARWRAACSDAAASSIAANNRAST